MLGKKPFGNIKKLVQRPFSFSIDNCTVAGESFCGLEVKYIEKEKDEFLGKDISIIKSELIGLYKLKESSSGETLCKLVKEKLLNDKSICDNFCGMAHDFASSLTGANIGLSTLLKADLSKYFFDMKDPCHGLNLALRNSLNSLPAEIQDFISDLHLHFNSPQRKALLRQIQEDPNNRIKRKLYLRKFVKTRWLSLGQSIERLLVIWPSLKIYMQYKINDKNSNDGEWKKLDYKYFYKKLTDTTFRFKIVLLNHIIQGINITNMKFQSPKIRISEVVPEISKCYKRVIQLVIKPDKYDISLAKLIDYNWENKAIQEEWFLTPKDFINNLVLNVSPGAFTRMKNFLMYWMLRR